MKYSSILLLSLLMLAQAVLASTVEHRLGGTAERGEPPLACGDLSYDDGTAEDAIFFGGGDAGRPNHFLGIRFELADFGIPPGSAEITGFCVSNSLAFSGGPWPNEVFVFRDLDGVPDLDNPQRRATMLTGDGTGFFETDFDQPWRLDEPVFWLLVRGDPIHDGEDFNVETDQSSEPSGRSWLTDRGIPFMIQTEQNLMLRANIRAVEAAAEPVPFLHRGLTLLLILVMLVVACIGHARRFSSS